MSTASQAPASGTRVVPDRAVLDRAVGAVSARRRAEVEVLESALAWAHAHVPLGEDTVAGWRSDTVPAPGTYAAAMFGERAIAIAGAGTPLVAEFAVMELAAAVDVSHESALALLGDALDLAHRLPRTWALVRELRVSVHVAREAARVSRDLDPVAAGHADRLLSWRPRSLNPHRVGVLVQEARLYADPDRAIADHDEAMAARKVEVRHDRGAPGTSEVFAVLDAADAVAFDHTVSTMAATMGSLGHQGSLGVRRAHAVGVLADPQKALDLLAVDPSDPDRPDPESDPDVCAAEDVAHDSADPFRRPTPRGAGRGEGSEKAVLVLHLSDRDLLADDVDHDRSGVSRGGVARSATLGPVLMARLRGWLLSAGKVTIAPVVDLAAMPGVDAHDPPARMAQGVRWRDERCVFPRCGRSSESCDLDHTDSYVPPGEGGPPGQTRPDNLAPLCRRHHRAKTFGGFDYRRLADGSYEWTLPTGTRVTTDPATPRPAPSPSPGRSRRRA